MLRNGIRDGRVEGPDKTADAFGRAAAIGSRDREVLAERHSNDLRRLALPLPCRHSQRADEISG
jgi:hypothetical protein